MWMKVDSGALKAGKNKDGKLDWSEALKWAEGLKYGGHTDWRLPNIKELQSIVDYTRSPDTTSSPAIDPVFKMTALEELPKQENLLIQNKQRFLQHYAHAGTLDASNELLFAI